MLETSLIFVGNFWQELMFGISVLTFSICVPFKIWEKKYDTIKVSKRDWLELKRLG